MNFHVYMKADQRSPVSVDWDFSPMLGIWYNTHPDTRYFVKIAIAADQGYLAVNPFGSNDGPPIEWGAVRAEHFGSGHSLKSGGFKASYLKDGIETLLAANLKLGVLVIQSYTFYGDGSGRASHYSREFFHR